MVDLEVILDNKYQKRGRFKEILNNKGQSRGRFGRNSEREKNRSKS